MKAKLVYAIVSEENDYFLEQAYVSMYSARYVMPGVFITLVMDSRTAENLREFRKTEAEFADEIVVVELDPTLPAKKRSRILKTSLRNVVNGDFLYIDCDTLVVSDLSDADSFDFSFGAVQDRHVSYNSNPFKGDIAPFLNVLGIDVRNNIYHNSGVMFVRDNVETRTFFKTWNEHYLSGYLRGVSQDQPSLAETESEQHLISLMDDVWNCQICCGLRYMQNAKIWHYFSSNSRIYILNNPEVLKQLRSHQDIPGQIKSLFVNPYLGFNEDCHVLNGDDLVFFASGYYSKLKRLLTRKTFVGKLITKILEFNDKFNLLKKKLIR